MHPPSVARFFTVSPCPRAMSLASASRLVSMKFFAPSFEAAASPQFKVPEVMPNVWLPTMPLSVAASTCAKPLELPRTTEPRPQPAVP